MADARLAHSASCCKSEAHRGLQRQGRGRRTEEMCMERCWVESGLCKRVCQRSSARRFACLCLGAVCGPYRGLDSDEALCVWYPRSTRRHGRPLRWCSRPSGATSRAPRPIWASADDGDPPSRRDASSRVRDSSRDSRSEKEKRKSCASAIIERGAGVRGGRRDSNSG